MDEQKLKNIIEAILMSAGKPLSADKITGFFTEEPRPSITEVRKQLTNLIADCDGRGIELVEVANGFRYQGRSEYGAWVAKLWEVKPQRYSRALLETLALIAYRQPVTRADIEDVRGVSVSTNIMKTLMEREWVQIVGHRDAPGRPAMYATTKHFLDYFNLKSLDQLPTLAEMRDLSKLEPELALDGKKEDAESKDSPTDEVQSETETAEVTPTDEPQSETETIEATPTNESIH